MPANPALALGLLGAGAPGSGTGAPNEDEGDESQDEGTSLSTDSELLGRVWGWALQKAGDVVEA